MNLPFSNSAVGAEHGARPMVAIRRNDRSAWWFAGVALIAAVLLFSALEARRQGAEQAKDPARSANSLDAPQAVPEPVIPALRDEASAGLVAANGWVQPGDQQPRRGAPLAQPRAVLSQPYYPLRQSYGEPSYSVAPPPLPSGVATPAPEAPGPNASGQGPTGGVRRVVAGRLETPTTTVIQGTLINAVLETALDSTRPGQTRAIVTRDVYGFDGKQLLIPRGTRLYGSYGPDVSQGQKRAQIQWTRLLRPDGVSVALDSPAADPLGRAGVTGRVNNHFFERLGNALIGTTTAVGSALVTRSITPSSPVVVALPGATQSPAQTIAPSTAQIMPTLTVRQGTRVAVFVQHDLDFTTVDGAP